MSVIEEVRREREDLARVLKKHSGIRKIVEDLYPDSAHFIYELLQNAEDREATQVRFVLADDKLTFIHNGGTFRPQDIYAITDIGEGTKTNDEDKIGRFGVGFKAVFAYTETPHIWSPTFSFKICELVLPSEIAPLPGLPNQTRFDFPFDNPKKLREDAHREIKTGLKEIAETTLLFLSHIESITWQIEGASSGEILRVNHAGPHVEILKYLDGHPTTSVHFLKFDTPVEGLPRQRAAVAFCLDYVPGSSVFASDKPLSAQLKIAPAAPGLVAVFFPAAKETSGLRFHVHAPFVPELSRASIKDTPANLPLFGQLAALAAGSLQEVRDLGLLTTDFLGILPNPQDQLGARYVCIRDAIINAMDNEPLTPTHQKTHAPAKDLFQAKASVKELLSPTDIEFLISYDEEPPQWASNRALQGTNAERFMNALSINDWDVDMLVARIVIDTSVDRFSGPNTEFMAWIGAKSADWHQQLYALLHREPEAQRALSRLMRARIVRLTNGTYTTGRSCHFSDEPGSKADGVQCVDPAVYSAGQSKAQQESAKRFLEAAGVTAIGERQLVQAILKSRHESQNRVFDERAYLADLRRFMKLLEDDPSSSAILAAFPLFMGKDNKWHKAAEIYLDAPYVDSGLAEYFGLRGVVQLFPLADFYQALEIDTLKIASFVEKLGGCSKLAVKGAYCRSNPNWAWLSSVGGERYTRSIDQDYVLDQFSALVAKRSLKIAKLIWNTMCSLPGTSNDESEHGNPLWAVYQRNMQGGAHKARSQLVHQLCHEAWIPQSGGSFVKPADARRELLPEGFSFDPGWPWIKAIEFGKNIQLESQKAQAEAAASVERKRKDQEAAEALGFDNAERARRLAAMPVEEQQRAVDQYERRQSVTLPDHDLANPVRRREKIFAHSTTAPIRKTEDRTRSVSIGRDEVKDGAKQYLRQQYTNADAEQICQICKDVLPFKLDDGSFYFETVEFLPELKRHFDQNYLCLCPNHTAMFKYANASRNTLHKRIAEQAENELGVVLAGRDETIYFTKTHLADLRTVVEADGTFQGDEATDIDS